MCWWGESALVVASRLKHGFILLLFSRKHLNSDAVLLPPIKLPVGMRPLFMQVGPSVMSCLSTVQRTSHLIRFGLVGSNGGVDRLEHVWVEFNHSSHNTSI